VNLPIGAWIAGDRLEFIGVLRRVGGLLSATVGFEAAIDTAGAAARASASKPLRTTELSFIGLASLSACQDEAAKSADLMFCKDTSRLVYGR
jgi:hypothetical protein